MARDEAPPFERGATWYGGGTIDANDLGGVNLEGKEFVFEDEFHGTGHPVRVRVVRNVSGAAIKPRRIVQFADAAYGRRVSGHAATTAQHGFPADERLPESGVPNNDLFYIVVEGPALVEATAVGTPTVSVGNRVCAVTAATTGTDQGRVVAQDLTGATAALGNQVQNAVGRALSALTAAQTGAKLLVGVGW